MRASVYRLKILSSRHDRAFTLIEVLVAAAILVLVAATAVNLMVSGKMAAKAAWEDTVAVNIAQAVMEELLAKRNLPVEEQYGEFKDESGKKIRYKCSISSVSEQLVQVRVTVYYQYQGRERQLELVTLKRRG
jgi:type II secretion system protein I